MGWLKTILTVFHLGLHFIPHLTLHLISQSEPLLR